MGHHNKVGGVTFRAAHVFEVMNSLTCFAECKEEHSASYGHQSI